MAQRSTRLPSGKATLYNFLLNELLASQVVDGYEFWALSPWITNFALERPYYVTFGELVVTRHEELHLFDVIRQIAANGGRVRITVGDDARFHAPLRDLCEQRSRIDIRVYPRLHAKAYAGHFGAVSGSLNLTGSGVHQNAEIYSYFHDPHSIAQVRQRCIEHFEQGEPLR
ncbi:MAG: phospholipase D-like domain-containing protein [Roseiflexaceae bacterium]|nr:phospholipase D-like domain-containing protein [Roseiflexus sp.]MDW8214121.1 phospholipase D-like domain-containing protein [Roseiflexaceae bacterium]